MGINVRTITTGLGIKTNYYGLNNGKLKQSALAAVEDLNNRHSQTGQFLKWVKLPEEQLKRIDYIYETANKLKNQTSAGFLSVIGIGGSKHPIEHMLSINGLNLDKKIKFISDIDTVSHNRFMQSIGGNPRNSNYLVVSKSGTTFEPKDALIRTKNAIKNIFLRDGYDDTDAQNLTSKYFVAVTDKSKDTSELRRTATAENWLSDLFIHDDVGGRFSAFDDHTLFTLAYAGMKKSDMIKMLESARDMSTLALSKDLNANDPLNQAIFWAQAKIQRLKTSVHQYLGSMFEDTVNWHAQMQNESIKNTLKQISKVPDAMHHSAEAHFNPANKYAFALTSPNDKGMLSQNLAGYVGALNKSYSNAGPHFNEVVDVSDSGLTAQAAGALTQSRAFATVYQDLIETINETQSVKTRYIVTKLTDFTQDIKEAFHNLNAKKEKNMPQKLKSVLQPHVETYKSNLKPDEAGNKVVDAGRTL